MLSNTSVLMTEGPIWRCLVKFAVPLLIGNLFQQLYNTVDSIIVGNLVGFEALAAVGSVEPAINVFIGFFMGLAIGCSVVISQYFGAQDARMVSRAVHTTVVFTLILSAICTAASVAAIPPMLRLMAVPQEVWSYSYEYLFIYFSGISGLMLYNMGSGILRAVGDSRRPLIFLLLSTCLNIALDIVFVAGLDMGVRGAAYATVIAQFASASLVFATLAIERDIYRLRVRELTLDTSILRSIVRIGLPSALQMLVTQISNVFVQSYINAFGPSAMAGWASYLKIDKICLLPMLSMGLSISTFVGQNLGAGDVARAKAGVRSAHKICLGISLAMIAFVIAAARPLVSLFSSEPEVIAFGVFFARMQIPFFAVASMNQIHTSALRGAGNTRVPVLLLLASFVAFRQVYLFVASRLTDSLTPIALGYPMGWVVASVLLAVYYHRVDIAKYKVV